VTFIRNPQCLRVELVEHIDERTEFRRLFFGAQLESLNRPSNDLPGGHPESARLGVERRPLLGRHQNHQSSGCRHG